MTFSRLAVRLAPALALTIMGALSSGCVQGQAPGEGDEAVSDSYQSFEEFLDATYK